MNIGEQIKKQRLEKELTQEQLGNLLNVSRSAVSSWEVGRNYPDLETIVSISDLFEIPLDNLLREDKEVVKDVTKKTRMNTYYKLIFKMLGIVLLIFLSISFYQKITEKRYINNLEKNDWQPYPSNEREEDTTSYELIEGDIDYYINLPNLKIITRKDNLVIEVKNKSDIKLIISKMNDSSVSESIDLKVDKDLNISDKGVDNLALIHELTYDLTVEYVEKHKEDYQEMINKTLEKIVEIKR